VVVGWRWEGEFQWQACSLATGSIVKGGGGLCLLLLVLVKEYGVVRNRRGSVWRTFKEKLKFESVKVQSCITIPKQDRWWPRAGEFANLDQRVPAKCEAQGGESIFPAGGE